jgi:NADH-quinone oxidoreductase subunit A
MLAAYTPILVMFLIALFIAVFVIVVSSILGPKKDTARKLAPYESGMEPIGAAIRRIPVKFYVVAMLFIVFDIEVVFFYPFALVFRALGAPGLVAMGVFFLVLVVGFIYEWKKGALQWE